jgi:hypothetical protein
MSYTLPALPYATNALAPLRVTAALLPRMAADGKVAIVTSRMGSISDNGSGGGGRRGGLSGGKGSVWEGGVRVPLIVRGPGVAANSWCHVPVVGYDLFPTFCEWAKVPKAVADHRSVAA